MRILVLLAAAGGLLRADIVTYSISESTSGFSYQVTLANTGDTGGTLFDLFLSVPTGVSNIDTSAIGTPPGWGDALGGLLFFGPDVGPSASFIEWAADFSGSYDLGLGRDLSGFSFTATQPVGTPVMFALNGSTALAVAQSVTAVPEPATFITLSAFFLHCLNAAGLRRRRPSGARSDPTRLPRTC
jgi:hypothetical protein